ncbi:MAG: hypothetical protein IT381_04885 [Deltaproteobacteria bacterium]|nr:hypothetical protein [Deltaproteobacteria bacterium]
MSSINFATKEISVKIVFYGPGLCGKTTTLQSIYQSIKPERRPQMVSLATDVDRTIYFDFLPVNAYKIGDFIVRLQLYTVPGQVFYNSTRKLVLNGVDGVVFVADSQAQALDDNKESLTNLAENLRELGMAIERVPYVLQYNKRDLPGVMSLEELNKELNQAGVPSFSTVALTGEGVQEVLKSISRTVISDLTSKGVGKKTMPTDPASRPPPPQPAQAPLPSSAPGPATDLEAAINQAAPGSTVAPQNRTAARPMPGSLSFSALWPTPELRARCREIEAAVMKGDYREAISSSAVLCSDATRPYGADASTHDPALEMLLRGVPGPRFVRYRELVQRARAGESVTLSDALFALHIAVELVV